MRSGKGVFTSIRNPSEQRENVPVDDHSQSTSGPRSGSDCSAAECLQPDSALSESAIVGPAVGEAALRVLMRPFVWQSGRRLLLLEREQGFWVFAEFEFEPEICRYAELRRSFYQWEREALGALLSRAIRFGEEAATEAAELLEVWMRRRRSTISTSLR